jgi:uncharacterized protein
LTQTSAVYTLARLMATVPRNIKPALLVKEQKCLQDSFEINEMHRLKAVLANAKGKVNYSLEFGKDANGNAIISGLLSAHVGMVCQRCLEAFLLPINNDVRIGLAFTEDELKFLPKGYEPMLVTEDKMSLLALVEDEMLLNMPMAPMHDIANCPSQELISEFSTKKESPFDVLKAVKK